MGRVMLNFWLVIVITTGSTHVRQEVELFRTRDRCENALVQYAPTVKPPAVGSGSTLRLECEGFPVPLRHFFKAEREA